MKLMISRSAMAVAVCAGILLGVVPALAADTSKPNFVFFLIDDLGWQDLGCYGSTFHETPRVDQLAKEGVLFTDAYAASPVCSPTRASILTGKYPTRVGITRATPQVSLALEEVTIAEALKEAGYRTAHMGKWHLQAHDGEGKSHFPEAQGFDVNIAGHSKGQPASYFYPYKAKSSKYAANDVPGLDGGKEGEFLTDRLTDEAITFIKDSGDQPFLLNLWYYAVHTPIMGKPEKVKRYETKARKMGLADGKEDAVAEHQSWHHSRQDDPKYAALVESMDENVGRILDTLQETGLDKNTVVIFMSDNGGLSTGKGKKAPTSNLPLRAGKGWVYEGGIREPMIIKWPGVTKPGDTCDEPVVSTDFYPTMLEMAGLASNPKQHLDGVSLVPLLKRETASLDRKALYFHFPQDHHVNSMGPSGAVRVGDFKLVEAYETKEVELYNLKDDIGEQHDLSKQLPEKTRELTTLLHQWHRDVGAELSLKKSRPQESSAKKSKSQKERPKKGDGNHSAARQKFYTPAGDKKAMAEAQKKAHHDTSLPSVLILGDSISIGYTPMVIDRLKGKANVVRAKANCGDSNRYLQSLPRWLGDTQWDVIHFNMGLHDLCYRHPDSKVQGNRDKVNGTIAVPLAEYEKNLEKIVTQLKATGARLIWASTTVVPEGEAGRVVGDDVKYNAAARKIMEEHGIPIDDLHALSATFPPELFTGPGNVHFKREGSLRLATQVSLSIEEALTTSSHMNAEKHGTDASETGRTKY